MYIIPPFILKLGSYKRHVVIFTVNVQLSLQNYLNAIALMVVLFVSAFNAPLSVLSAR